MKRDKQRETQTPRMRTIVIAKASEDGITWVNGHRINMLTKWNHRDLEYLREEGNITYKKEGRKVKYDLESVKRYWLTVKDFSK